MAYRTPQPPIQSFPDKAQQAVVRRISERLDNLETVTQSQAADSTGRIAPAPPQALLNASVNPSVKGHVYLRVLNPEFLGTKQNQAGSAIRHHLQACTTPGFKSGVVDFPVTHQTYFDISELGSGTFYFQHRSTYDGKTFNSFVLSPKVVIP